MNKNEIVITLVIWILAGIVGAFGALCFIAKENGNKTMLKKYRPIFIFFSLLIILLLFIKINIF